MMSGFDDIETILQMDIGEGPNNSIDAIEKFINKKRFPSCMGPHQLVDETFEFPPGHKLKIQKFIRDIQQQHHSPAISEKRKPTTVQPKKAKKKKHDDESQSNENANINAITEIRQKVLTWGKKEKVTLLENDHFTICVKRDVVDSGEFSVSIQCRCGKKYAFHKKSKSWLISNWTRHFKSCDIGKLQQTCKQGILSNYFSPTSQPSVSSQQFELQDKHDLMSTNISLSVPNSPPFAYYNPILYPPVSGAGFPFNVTPFHSPYIPTQSHNPGIGINPAGSWHHSPSSSPLQQLDRHPHHAGNHSPSNSPLLSRSEGVDANTNTQPSSSSTTLNTSQVFQVAPPS